MVLISQHLKHLFQFSLFALLPLGLSASASSNLFLTCRSTAATRLTSAISPPAEPYVWRNVTIAGMGFVTGLLIHPAERDLLYARTDVGGAFRWNAATQSWVALMDQFGRSQSLYYSIESLALAPTDPELLYAAVGGYTNETNSDVLKSRDRGQTWTPTRLKTPTGSHVRMGGNEEWRWAGERLAIDPRNSQIVYFGSRLDGLYRTLDGAVTWNRIPFPVVDFAPNGKPTGGITFVQFDPRSPPGATRSPTLYVGVMGNGVYRSTDAGATWTLISGDQALNPQQAAIASDGTLYVTAFGSAQAPGGVWKYRDGGSSSITPSPNKSFSAVTIAPADPNTVMVAAYPLTPDGIYRSTTGGASWQRVRLAVKPPPWYPGWHLYTLTGGLAIDPHLPNRVWLTTGFGVFRTDNIASNPSDWVACMTNLELLVTFVVKQPPNGALLSGVADMHGFRHDSLTIVPSQTQEAGQFGDTTGIDFSEANPNLVARVGSSPGSGGREDSQGRSAYSADGGRSWRSFANLPAGAANGKVAVSATLQPNGYPVIVWAPQGDLYPVRSLDGGQTWLPVRNAPNRTTRQLWFPNQAIAADRVDGNLFYLYQYSEQPNQGRVYRSTDGGATWEQTAIGLPDYYLHTLKAVPGRRGEVWLSVRGSPLSRSQDAGRSFTRVAQIEAADEVTFGKAAPGRDNPTVFVYGRIQQAEGLYRSDDATSLPGEAAGATWVKLSTPDHALGTTTYLEGDRQRFGRVYVGTGGRGILYGEMRSAEQATRNPKP